MRAIDVYFDASRDARARAVLAARSSRTRLHRGIVLEAAHVQLGPAAVGVEGELWQPAARGSRWVCQGDQTSGWDRAVWSLISVFIRYANSLPLEDYCHSNKEIGDRVKSVNFKGRTTLSGCLYLIPAATPSPFARRRKSASNSFAGARKPDTCGFSLSGPAWAHADHADASSFWVCMAAPNAPMLPAALPSFPVCALPPPSYLFSGAHCSPVSISFLSGLLAGCSPGWDETTFACEDAQNLV